MDDLFDTVDVEDLRVFVWSLYDESKMKKYSCFLEFVFNQMGYKMLYKILERKLEKNKQIYIKEISEGS